VDLAVVTGEKKYLDQAKQVFEDSFSSVWINGDFPESYGDYYERCDETCSAVDWMTLALKLFDVTGETKYLDWVELTMLNDLPCSQDNSGNFTTYRSLNRRHWMDAKNHLCAQTDCCSMSGGWGMAQAIMHAATSNSAGLSINLPADVACRVERDGGSARVEQRIRVEKQEIVQSLQIRNETAKPLEVKVRVPYWCPKPVVRVSESRSVSRVGGGAVESQRSGSESRSPAAPAAKDGFLRFSCVASGALDVELRLAMRLEVIPARRNILNKDQADGPNGAIGDATEKGLQYGPYVLMFNREMYPAITAKDIGVTVPVDAEGRPRVSQEIPKEWDAKRGAVPLFIEAKLGDGANVLLTPCANLPLTPFTVTDPYVLRFAEVVVEKR
jgi:hypothetical protein